MFSESVERDHLERPLVSGFKDDVCCRAIHVRP